MKTLIVSDIHLSHVFDEKKYLFLKKLFSSFDRIILNGDFWDGHIISFNHFISSKWSGLFPLLKSKGAIYLYGNHDQKQFNDKRMSLFSVEQKESHILTFKSTTYHIEHGHVLYPSFDMIIPFSPILLYCIAVISQYMENLFFSLGNPHTMVLKQANKTMKKKLKRKQFPHWYLCGHTHCAEFDAKNRFANSGFIQFGKASYLIVDSSGPSLRTESYT